MTSLTTNSLTGTIPALSDTANIVTAFTNYHNSLANTSTGAAVLARANTFGGVSGATQTIKTATGGSLEVSTVNASKNGISIIATDNAGYPARFRPILAGTSMSNSEFYYDGTNDRWISEVPLYAEIKPRGGSATQAPMTFTSGTVLTTPAAGVLEYNGQFFVTGNTTTKRALVSSKHLYSLTSTKSLTTSAGTVPVFGVSLALEANTVYEFEIWFGLTAATSVSGSNTAISCSVAIPSSSTGSFEATSSSGTSTSSATRDFATNQSGPLTATSVTYSGTSSTATGQYHIKGIVRTSSTASSFTPNVIITNNTNALTSLTVLAGSYASVSKIGAANANIVTGAWT